MGRRGIVFLGAVALSGLITAGAEAQGPGGRGRPGPGAERPYTKAQDVADLVSRMLAFDSDHDGKLTRAEVTDARLTRLFDRADANHDGAVTRDELTSLGEREHSTMAERGPGGGPGGPRGGPPPGPGPGGPGGPGGRPGEVLPAMLQDRLDLSKEQREQIAALQKEVDARLAKILTVEQRAELRSIRERGPMGRGPGGPPGGFGGPPGGGPPR